MMFLLAVYSHFESVLWYSLLKVLYLLSISEIEIHNIQVVVYKVGTVETTVDIAANTQTLWEMAGVFIYNNDLSVTCYVHTYMLQYGQLLVTAMSTHWYIRMYTLHIYIVKLLSGILPRVKSVSFKAYN